MNLSQAVIARSDQLNADDLVTGPQTFTVSEVRRGDAEQPVAIVLAEYPANRPFKPSKTVIRILAHGWGEETDDWPEGARFTLYRDEKVKWAGQEIGGIRVSHMSHIPGRIKIALAESKGKKTLHVVDPLPAAPTAKPTVAKTDTITPEQTKQLADAMKQLGMTDRPTVLAYVNDVIGREVASSTDLTKTEAAAVIDALERDIAGKSPAPAEPELDYDPTTEPGWSNR